MHNQLHEPMSLQGIFKEGIYRTVMRGQSILKVGGTFQRATRMKIKSKEKMLWAFKCLCFLLC